jgi:hypothetical protein
VASVGVRALDNSYGKFRTLTCSEVNFLERRNDKDRLRSPKLRSRRHRSASEEARIGGGPVKGERRKERTARTL